ncbi:MAG: tripartite tricarboxylate transporter substrate binding protein [Burkholderiaceae bacterium]|nr:tripartite tricarboxylate transporter substrate binding protein [Burkholderiaceae bacterium]
MTLSRRHLIGAAATTAATLALPAWAQGSGPLKLVVPYAPGGPLDRIARMLADAVKDSLGTVIVENKPGAGGNLGVGQVARAAADGQTIVMGAVATHAINPWLYAKIPFDPIKDFTPITRVAQVPNVLVMNAEAAGRLNIASVADLVAYAKANPARLNYGSGGNGSAGHLAGELFKSSAGVFAVHIPYAGAAPMQLALLAGQIDFSFDNLASAAGNIRAGKLKALAVTTARRAGAMPELPTMAEAGLPAVAVDTWFGLFGPAGVPVARVQALNAAFTAALRSDDVKAKLAPMMAEPSPTTPDEFAAFVKAELAKYEGIVKATGARVG